MAHKILYPDIWTRSIYEVEWFGQLPQPLTREPVVQGFPEKSTNFNIAPPYNSFEHSYVRKETFRPNDVEEVAPWASHSPGIRRGVDLPFATKPSHPGGSTTNASTLPPTLPLSLPNRTATPGSTTNSTWTNGSRFIERFRESTLLARPETTNQFSTHYHVRKDSSSFPRSVDDVDQPIPLTRLSEWISADGRQGSGKGEKEKSRRWI